MGCPTANIDPQPYRELLDRIALGVYWGVACVSNGTVYGMAMNVGWSPFYQNKHKTIEVHIFNNYGRDFYGEELRAVALGYIRPEANFSGLQQLKDAIADDIAFAKQQLTPLVMATWTAHPFITHGSEELPQLQEEKK